MNRNYIKYLNDNLNLIKINNEEIKYKEIIDFENIYKIEKIKIIITKEKEKVKREIKKMKLIIPMKLKNNNIIEILLLEEYYGQISSIDISIGKKENKIKYVFAPISIRNDNTIYYLKKIVKNDDKFKDIIPKIIINDKNLVNINYLNYLTKNFNIIDYFGGIVQFLPFYTIFKKFSQIKEKNASNLIITNEESLNFSYVNKNSVFEIIDKDKMNNFVNFILKRILEKLNSEKHVKIFEKYFCFIFCLILDLDIYFQESLKNYIEKHCFYKWLDLPMMVYYSQKNFYFSKIEEELKMLIKTSNNENSFNKPKKTINQLYNECMKNLFCFNGYWSKRKIFYPKRYKNEINDINETKKEIKYKQINYYTKNFQMPYFYPILEYKNHFPSFRHYKGNIFKENNRNFLEYNFKLDINEKAKKIINTLISENKNNRIVNNISEECCLVKNTHHIFGKLSLIYKQNDKNKFALMFENIKKNRGDEEMKCNKNNKIRETNSEIKINIEQIIAPVPRRSTFRNSINSPSLCYGAVFPCPKRDSKRNVNIKSKNILFILIREYYHRVSAIEIFTINKSYYFNFRKKFEVNNIKTNLILNEIKNNSCFKEIKIKNNKWIIGYYNKKFRPYLYPLFEGKIDVWEKKYQYLCNYDIISYINLFSNRSFRDIFQYPIFPLLYDLIGAKRKMSQHIGMQSINFQAKTKRDIIIKTYLSNDESQNDFLNTEENILFHIHYSNPAFTFNFLLRVIPYSYLAIEFQGDGFDDPNRLFYSIEGALESTLTIKSDLREMIPELYYMIELFYNKNNLSLGVLHDGTEIDNVIIKKSDIIESEIKRKETIAHFLHKMRFNLDNESEIDNWIDLIFGINQQFYRPNEKFKYRYYEKNSEITFKNDPVILKDNITMDQVNFGLLPYQLFKEKFPEKKINDEILPKEQKKIEELQKLNIELFKDEHLKINSPIFTFVCKGRILIDPNYLKIIDPNGKRNKTERYYDIFDKGCIKGNESKINKLFFNKLFDNFDMDDKQVINNQKKDLNNLVNYYFFGNVFGTVLIYSLKELDKNEPKSEQKNENKKEFHNQLRNFKYIDETYKLQFILINKLYDHSKEIKYIDFNPRLNLLLTYSLDEFINVYIFPKCKLINTIDTISFKDKNDKNYFDEVALLSYPFPSIFCHNKEYIYLLSINGELIKRDNFLEGQKIIFSIDKNLGLAKDEIIILSSDNKLNSKFNHFEEEKETYVYRNNTYNLLFNK